MASSSIVVAKKRSRIDYCSNEFNSILPSFLFPTLITMATKINTNTNTGQQKRIRNNENLHHSSELPHEILLEIMFYLNAKDLQNYKSVSKFWYSSISSPDFINTHLTLIKQTPSEQEIILTTLQIPKNQTSIHEYSHFSITNIQNNNSQQLIITPKNLKLPFHINHKNIALSLQAACDGLLLFQDKYNPKQLYVSNPVTSQFEPLPPIPLYCITWALVRDTRNHKYKVFGVNSVLQCTVFILGEKTPNFNPKWDTCTVSTPTKMNDSVFSQLFLRRKELHWLTTDVYVNNGPLVTTQECYCLYSVNIQTYGFIRSRIPPQLVRLDQISATKGLHLLSEVNRSLCLTIVSTLQLEMFLLKDRLNSIWTKSLTVRLHSLSNQPSFFHSFLSDDICLIPTQGVNGADLLDLVKVYIHRGDQLFMYDLKTQECMKLGFLSKEQKLCSRYFFNSDSLVSWTSLSGGI